MDNTYFIYLILKSLPDATFDFYFTIKIFICKYNCNDSTFRIHFSFTLCRTKINYVLTIYSYVVILLDVIENN